MTESLPTQLSAPSVEAELKAFLETRTKTVWESDADLFESGAVSSLFAMELVVFVENTFDVTVSGPDLTLANFRTVREMATMVLRLAGSAGE
ncbi:acyl carrier protein [Streptomyces sp. NPDC001933]|uniref:acyl carrier protein n=1 Tax=Streptomyces sp. NPDC001933 TaxID=3364626 RepID=UPI0036891A2E